VVIDATSCISQPNMLAAPVPPHRKDRNRDGHFLGGSHQVWEDQPWTKTMMRRRMRPFGLPRLRVGTVPLMSSRPDSVDC
jgi:hypothetical protein